MIVKQAYVCSVPEPGVLGVYEEKVADIETAQFLAEFLGPGYKALFEYEGLEGSRYGS